MGLSKPTPSRERILLYGQEGTGKTTAWARIAAQSDAKVYVGDTDQTVLRTLEGYPDRGNIVVADLFGADWSQFIQTFIKFTALGTKDDWLVLDTADTAWDTVQAEFSRKVFGQDIDEWFLAFRKDNPKGGSAFASDYGTNWQVINRMYGKYIQAVLKFKGHILSTCPADELNRKKSGESNESPEVNNLYGRIGWKPKGQKLLGYQHHTVLMTQNVGESYMMTTVKDREREKLKGATVSDFVEDYLVKVAGWQA